jgi:hypothetical protein
MESVTLGNRIRYIGSGPEEAKCSKTTDPSGDQARIIHLHCKHRGTYMLEEVAHAFGFGRTDNDDVLPGAPGTNAALQQRGSDTAPTTTRNGIW